MRVRLVIGGAALLAALVPATVSAVPPTASGSCPAGPLKWELVTPAEAAAGTYEQLLDPPPTPEEYEHAIEGYDVNTDGDVCLATRAQKNANAHFIGYPYFIYKDNNTGVAP